MKGIKMFLVPLFVIPFLTGCKFGNLEDTHMLLFNTSVVDSYMKIDGEKKDSIITNQKVVAEIVPEDGFKYPITIKLTVGDTEEAYTGKYEYDENTGKFAIKMISDVMITATATIN